jgi:site-specific recombinase XerD
MKITDIDRPDRPSKPYGLRWYVNRKPKHRFFESKKARTEHRKKLEAQVKKEGVQATRLNAAQALEYVRARDLLAGRDVTVLEAVEGYLKHTPNSENTIGLRAAIKEYLEASSHNVSPSHFKQIERALSNYQANFGNKLVVTPKEFREWMNGLPFQPQTKANYRKKASAFYRFALKNEWISTNPVAAVEPPTTIEKEVETLTPEQTEFLFRANQDAPGPVLARLALEAFAGLRFSSACRVSIGDIKWKLRGIELPAAKLKTKRRQFIDGLPDNLWQWLELARSRAEDWEMAERNYLYHKGRAFENANALCLAEKEIADGVPHPKNALRHSFATYHVALHKSPARTATILCHRSEKKLWDHYKGRATEDEGKRYFEIKPTSETK